MATLKQQRKAARAVARELLDKYVLMRRVAADPTQLLIPKDVTMRKRLGIPIRPEIPLTNRAIKALRCEGIKLKPTSYLHAPPLDDPTEWNPIYCYGPTSDVPVIPRKGVCIPEYKPHPIYDCFVDATPDNITRLELGLQALWNRAMGLCPSSLRFFKPVATDGPELEEWLQRQQSRLNRAGLPKPVKKAPPTTFPVPQFVIVVNTDRAVVQVRWARLSQQVDLAKYPGVQRVFEAVVKAEEEYFGRLPELPPISELDEKQKNFVAHSQVIVTYAELSTLCHTTTDDTNGLDSDKAMTQPSPCTALNRTTMGRVRQQISRFNTLFRKAAGRTQGYVLKPLNNGTWLLQTPVYLTPANEDNSAKKYKHPARNWDSKVW